MLKQKGMLVGAGRFELPTPGPPDRCANRAALRSDVGNKRLSAYANRHKSGIAPHLPTALPYQPFIQNSRWARLQVRL